jgi:PilZ domain
MLSGLRAWFTGKDINKRKYVRRRKPFRASYSLDGKVQKSAIGLDISGGGCQIITQEPVIQPEFEMWAVIDDRTVKFRARSLWGDNVTYQGKKVYRYGLQFTGIAADDWDAIVRYASDRVVAEPNKAAQEIARVRMTPDDTARLIPLALQNRMLAMLVQKGWLAPLEVHVNPLVQFFYSGIARHDGRPMHKLTIQ